METNNTFSENKDAQKYPGVDINVGDGQKEDQALVKERTRTLNNNPRNDDGPED